MESMTAKFAKLAHDAIRGAQTRCIYATWPEYLALLDEAEGMRLYRSEHDIGPLHGIVQLYIGYVRVKPYPPIPIRMGRYGPWHY